MSLFDKVFGSMFAADPEQEERIASRIDAFNIAVSGLSGAYTTNAQAEAFRQSVSALYVELKGVRVPKKHKLYSGIRKFLHDYEAFSEITAESNKAFIAAEKSRYDALLSSIDGKSLDDQQRTAVVTDEDRNLVVAGAGSGKTLTVAGKVRYLCEAKGIDPEDILLIGFTRKSAEEMGGRICGRLGIPVQATTFHKLGLDIITAAGGRRPDVRDELGGFVREYFEKKVVGDPKAMKNIVEYFAYYLNISSDMERHGSLGEVYEAEKGADLETLQSKYQREKYLSDSAFDRGVGRRTLQNEQVKSLAEVSIANYLFLNGIRYEYERRYPFESDDPARKAYRPDFYLPDHDIYIEHFGINKEGKLPWLSAVEEKKYQDDMRWKRDFHRRNGTKLLETYSYYSSEGRLTEELEKLLKANGVQFREPDFADIFNTVYASKSDRYISEFIKLCCTFITLYKSAGRDPSEIGSLRSRNPAHQKPFYLKRNAVFLEIVRPILIAYNASLKEQGAVDFSDMINEAAGLVAGGFRVHPYSWVIVDEYQDISVARYKLLKAVLDQTGAKLLCVGDDWQSIYRFAGSDIGLFTHFERYFGSAATMRLEQTYRNSQQLIDISGAFVMKNPLQYRKDLRSAKSIDRPLAFMYTYDDPDAKLRWAMDQIISESGADSSVMFLGRTNYDLDILRVSNLFQVRKNGTLTYINAPSVRASFLTVHQSKGLEADNVILLNFQNATLGFPNKIADDPLLELVLTESDSFPYAEERRLLYVALTRTRSRVFVLVDGKRPSEFMREFEKSDSVRILKKDSHYAPDVKCPRCRTGHLVIRKNRSRNGTFVGCSNYPRCSYTVRDTAVLSENRLCPKCGGFLVRRSGYKGRFLGCSNYPLCTYAEEIRE